ncbi:MAG: phytanoyl-CoA dioxygenase family protein [Candidatus Hydrogenedens sp.]|nr:phytanoyl-CoA dioxygenase family protein [Candidatus Hydrogenedens sp.]
MDLATSHAPVSDLFKPQQEADPASFALSPEQLEQYERDGFVAGIRLLNDAQCDALCEELAGLASTDHPNHHLFHEYHSNESADPSTVLFHALGAWRAAAGFHDLLWNPAFLVPASQLLGEAVRMWHDQLFCKPAGHGGVVAWHQDFSYWTRTTPMQHLTCWIGLDDATQENGCLQYVPGSHRWPLLPITGLAGDMEAIQTVLTPEQQAAFKPVAIELKRGEAAFHHPLLVHGSYGNTSERPRRAAVINVMRDGVCSDTDEALLEGVPPIPPGSPLGGHFFPLLYAPAG